MAQPGSAQSTARERAMAAAEAQTFEKERIELLRELKRVLTLVLEQQHDNNAEFNEDDPPVKELLVWVERCLWHGLKRSLVRGEKFEQETKLTLWSVLSTVKLVPHSKDTNDEDLRDLTLLEDTKREVFEMFEVRTDSGRSRAWVRLALNKGVLGCIGWLRDADAWSFYDAVSIWRSAEQKSIAVALLSSLKGLRFALKIDGVKLDADPEPSRRPHFLGISTMRASAAASLSPPAPARVETAETLARRVKTNQDRQAVQALKGKAAEMAAPPQAPSIVSWFKDTFFGPDATQEQLQKSTEQMQPKKLQRKRVPPFLGSTLAELVMDPRTCDSALLEWRIGVPIAISNLLLLVDLEESTDPFDPRLVAEEDDPRFVAEVGSLIKRLSHRNTSDSNKASPLNAWDGGSPAVVAVAALKLFFRQLPQPIIPYDAYDALVACQKIGDINARVRNIKFLIDSIPDIHKPTLLALIDVVGRKCDSNVTDTLSVANALAPALLRPKPGPEGGLGRASEAAELVSILIERRTEVFSTISSEIADLKSKLDRKLSKIHHLFTDARKPVEWPGSSGDEEAWMRRAWVALAPQEEEPLLDEFAPVTPGWIKRGFRTEYMTHDFRGCGLVSLKNLVYLAETYPDFTKRMLAKHQTFAALPRTVEEQERYLMAEATLSYEEKIQREENRSKFPFVLGAAQMSRAVVEMIGIDPKLEKFDAKSIAELSTWHLFDDEQCSGHMFSLAMRLLDLEWSRQKAKAMDFNRIRREVVLRLADVIDSQRPRTINELRVLLQRDAPALSDFKPQAPVTSPLHKKQPEVEETKTSNGEVSSTTLRSARESSNWSDAPHNDLLPRLICHFANVEETILTPSHVAPLEAALPSEYRGYDWELVFSTFAQGFNLDTFYQLAASHAATFLVISDAETKSVFGGFCSETWHDQNDEHYGTGQTFLFSFADGFREFHWTHANTYFMLSNMECLAMGQGSDGFGLYLDGDLKQGVTSPSTTFGNDKALVVNPEKGYDGKSQDFTCRALELWTFVPKTVGKRRASLT